jgi:acetaldehyde dehydrogenase/alcohol dehydrogenase
MTTEIQAVSAEETALFENAKAAVKAYGSYNLEQVTKIIHAVSAGCTEKAEFYAEWAVRDTGYGNVEGKLMKKQLAAQAPLTWNIEELIEPQVDREKKLISYPRPAGVVVGLMPCTNPVSTVIFLSMMALCSRNSIILLPHPAALACSVHAADLVNELAVKAGAPKNIVQVLRAPSIPAVNSVMANADANLILAIGGPGMVRAAYSSGTPAMGVGAANVPCYVHETADVATAGPRIVYSSSFDNSLACVTESVVLADEAIADALKESMIAGGAYFVNKEEEQKLRDVCWPDGQMEPAILGQDPSWFAEKGGFTIPEGVKSLVVEITEIGPQELVSKEKLWPVLGFKVVKGGVNQGTADALAMLDMMGKGHSASIHAKDPNVVAQYTQAMPVCRVSVNTSNTEGLAGGSSLDASLMIGTGYFGHSSVDVGVTAKNLVQYTRAAYSSEETVEMGEGIEAAVQKVKNNQV